MLDGTSFEPVVAAVSKVLRDQPQPLKGMIPNQVHTLVSQTRQLLKTTSIDLCENEAVQSILKVAQLMLMRDLRVLDRVMQPYCAEYQKFLESANGKILVSDLNQMVRDAVQPAPVPVV